MRERSLKESTAIRKMTRIFLVVYQVNLANLVFNTKIVKIWRLDSNIESKSSNNPFI